MFRVLCSTFRYTVNFKNKNSIMIWVQICNLKSFSILCEMGLLIKYFIFPLALYSQRRGESSEPAQPKTSMKLEKPNRAISVTALNSSEMGTRAKYTAKRRGVVPNTLKPQGCKQPTEEFSTQKIYRNFNKNILIEKRGQETD